MPYKRENSPYWWISYQDASGRRVRRSAETEDRKEAEALEHQLKAEGIRGRKLERKGTGFAAIMVTYLKAVRGERERYIVTNLREHFGHMDMTLAKPSDVTAYVDKRRGEGTADGTIRRELAVLAAAINRYATEHGITMPNITKGRMPKTPESRIRWITREEADRLIVEARKSKTPYLEQFIVIALNTGMRKDEILGLKWSQTNFVSALIHLEGSETKSGKRRSVPINEACRQALISRWHFTGDKWLGRSPYVFGEKETRPGNIRKSFMTACKLAGIDNFTPHDLRHTCAAWLVSSGVPLSEVRDLLGHSSITMTEKYAHLCPSRVAAAVRVLDGMVATVGPAPTASGL